MAQRFKQGKFAMFRLAFFLDVIIAPTLMGALVLVAMLTPAFAVELGKWMLIAAAGGFVIAIPVSLVAAKLNVGRLA